MYQVRPSFEKLCKLKAWVTLRVIAIPSLQWMESPGIPYEPSPGHLSLFLPAVQGKYLAHQAQTMASPLGMGGGGGRVSPLGIFRVSERQEGVGRRLTGW